MSLRTKQALILFLATVLPFAIGGAAMDLVVAPSYRRVVQRASAEVAQHLADHVAWSLERDVASLQRIGAWDRLRALARQPPVRSAAEAQELGREWPRLAPDSPPVRAVMENPVGWELWHWQQTDLAFLEVFATDARGYLIAASRKPSDFIQNDED